MVQHGFSQAELQAVLQLIAYIKGVAAMMTAVEGDIAWVLREAIHADVQEFARVYVASLLKRVSSSNMDSPYARTLLRIRAVAADWAGIPEEEALEVVVKSRKGHPVNEDDLKRLALPRPTPPSLAQIHCLQHLVQALVIGASAGVKGGFFGPEKSKQGGKEEGGKSRSKGRDREVSASEIKELDNFLQRLLFFPHLLDYPNAVLLPFTIYDDAADAALRSLKRQFLFDEVEAEVGVAFDQLLEKLSLAIFTHFKQFAASKLLDKSFVAAAAALGVGGRYSVTPCSYSGLLRQTHLQLLGRTVDMRDLLTQRLNKLTRHNLDHILARMEGADICHIMETHHLVDVLRGAHRLVAEHCPAIDSFEAIFTEATHATSLSSLSSRTAAYHCPSRVVPPLINSFEDISPSPTHATSLSSLSSRTAAYPCPLSSTPLNPSPPAKATHATSLSPPSPPEWGVQRGGAGCAAQPLWNATTRRFVRVAYPKQQRPMRRPVAHLVVTHAYSPLPLGSQVCREVEQDVLPNFLWNATTRRFVRVASPLHLQQRPVQRPAVHLPSPEVYEAFMFGNKDLNEAYSHICLLNSQFLGQPHMDAVVALLGAHSH
ncbi:unnamed protein product, partial [Closterium sp. Naga37s-1]